MLSISAVSPIIRNGRGTMQGRLTGRQHPCFFKGCHGFRLQVRWADDSLTWPCSSGLLGQANGSLRIGHPHLHLPAHQRNRQHAAAAHAPASPSPPRHVREAKLYTHPFILQGDLETPADSQGPPSDCSL